MRVCYFKRLLLIVFIFGANFTLLYASDASNDLLLTTTLKDTLIDSTTPAKQNLYDSLDLGKLGLSRRAYEYAIVGFKKLQSRGAITNNSILSIIDFTLPSDKKRLFILDLKSSIFYFIYNLPVNFWR